jgi:hypothetical protein
MVMAVHTKASQIDSYVGYVIHGEHSTIVLSMI